MRCLIKLDQWQHLAGMRVHPACLDAFSWQEPWERLGCWQHRTCVLQNVCTSNLCAHTFVTAEKRGCEISLSLIPAYNLSKRQFYTKNWKAYAQNWNLIRGRNFKTFFVLQVYIGCNAEGQGSFVFFFFHFNNDVQRCCKTIRMLIEFFVLVAKRLELQPTQL